MRRAVIAGLVVVAAISPGQRMPLIPSDHATTTYTLTAGQHLDLGRIKVGELSLPTGDAGVTP
ncbi:MAG TPA: hypothetical protein VGO00_21415 [Kofleriaceae bacterium]|nr:hypothetical protein [Kofleriaceae bacterium]